MHPATGPLNHADTPEEVGLSTRRLQAISSRLCEDVDRRKIPGAVEYGHGAVYRFQRKAALDGIRVDGLDANLKTGERRLERAAT